MIADEFDEFVWFCAEHGGHLENHLRFGEAARELRNKIAALEPKLTTTVVYTPEVDFPDMASFFDAIAEHLEEFAAAYIKATNIPPQDAKMVIQTLPDRMTFHFERKDVNHQDSQ